MKPGICPIHRRKGCTCGGVVTDLNESREVSMQACLCVHAVRDHVIDMVPVPLLRCIAFGCDCQVFACVVQKAS